MNRIIGEGTLSCGSVNFSVLLEMDLDEGRIIASKQGHASSLDVFKDPWSGVFALHDVKFLTPIGPIMCDETNNLLLVHCSRPASSIHESALTQMFDLLGEGWSLASRFVFQVSPGRICFRVEGWEENSACAIFRTTDFTFLKRAPVYGIGKYSLAVSQHNHSLIVRSEGDIPIEPLKLATSLMSGVPTSPLGVVKSGELDLYFERSFPYSNGHGFRGGPECGAELFGALLNFFVDKNESELIDWRKGVECIVQGRSGPGLLDTKTIVVFVFIEIFDGANTLSKSSARKMFHRISVSDSELIYRVRNALLHSAVTLNDAIEIGLRQVQSHPPAPVFGVFRRLEELTRKGKQSAAEFYFVLNALVNSYIADRIGWTGPFNDYDTGICETK